MLCFSLTSVTSCIFLCECSRCNDSGVGSDLKDVLYLQWLGGTEFSGGLATSDSYSGEGSPPQQPVVSVPENLWGRQGHYKLFVHPSLCFIIDWRLHNVYSKANELIDTYIHVTSGFITLWWFCLLQVVVCCTVLMMLVLWWQEAFRTVLGEH